MFVSRGVLHVRSRLGDHLLDTCHERHTDGEADPGQLARLLGANCRHLGESVEMLTHPTRGNRVMLFYIPGHFLETMIRGNKTDEWVQFRNYGIPTTARCVGMAYDAGRMQICMTFADESFELVQPGKSIPEFKGRDFRFTYRDVGFMRQVIAGLKDGSITPDDLYDHLGISKEPTESEAPPFITGEDPGP